MFKETERYNRFVIIVLCGALAFVWINVWDERMAAPGFYFLDVGQGDAELIIFPGGAKILTDAGPDGKVSRSLASVVGNDKYIDLGIISHPQLDHFNGFNFLLDEYTFGAIIINGRSDSPGVEEWPALLSKIEAKKIPLITLKARDAIKYREHSITMLFPVPEYLQSAELNDTGLVELIEFGSIRALFAADIDSRAEEYITETAHLRADILKVAHHGSKYSSSEAFLAEVQPKAAIIETGVNSYGHPAPETLARLAKVTPNVFSTKENGTIRVTIKENKLMIFTER